MSVRPYTSLGTASYVVPNVANTGFPCFAVNIQGYFRAPTTDQWLQVHDAAALPSNGAVPLKVYPLQAASAFSWRFDPTGIPLVNGLVLAVSTTEATLTVGTGVNVADWDVDIEEFERRITGLTESSGAALDELTLWSDSESNSAKRVYYLTAANTAGGTRYLMQFATVQPLDGAKPVNVWTILNNATVVLNFGTDGMTPATKVANTIHYGCYFAMSSTPETLTFSPDGATAFRWGYK